MSEESKPEDEKGPSDSGGTNPPQPSAEFVTKEEFNSRFDSLEEKITGFFSKPKGPDKPTEESNSDEEEERHLSRIAAAEAKARKMVMEAAEKVIAEMPKPTEKKEEKQEPEKPPIKPRRLTSMLWGSE